MSPTGKRFVILEDHPLVRSALRNKLVLDFEDSEIAYEGPSIEEAIRVIEKEPVDCVLLDLDLGDQSHPIDNLRLLVDAGAKVMVLSTLGDPAIVRQAMAHGALAYVSKSGDESQIRDAITSTLAGLPFMSPEIALALMSDADAQVKLSEQERTALSLYASGMKMIAVARIMNVSVTTAQEYIKRVRAKYTKAGYTVSTKTDLYRVAKKSGLVD
jgi:DNA-binding NarL/FixJ family response regulator